MGGHFYFCIKKVIQYDHSSKNWWGLPHPSGVGWTGGGGSEGWELGTPAGKQQESSRWVTLRPGKWGHRDENQERNTRNNLVEGQRGTREEHELHAWMTQMIMSSAETEVSGAAGWEMIHCRCTEKGSMRRGGGRVVDFISVSLVFRGEL